MRKRSHNNLFLRKNLRIGDMKQNTHRHITQRNEEAMGMVDPSRDSDNAARVAGETEGVGGAGAGAPPLLPLSSDLLSFQDIKETEEKDKLLSEDRDRKSRELKSGLHPLQVFLYNYFCIVFYLFSCFSECFSFIFEGPVFLF